MFRKTKQFVRQNPGLFFIAIAGLISLGLDAWNKDGLARMILLLAAAAALIPAIIAMNRIFKSGFFGINLLPVTALITALLLQQGWTALVLALILVGEKPLIALLGFKHSELVSASHASFVRLLDTFSVPFTMMIVLIAGSLWIVSGDASRFLEILAVASPAPLLVAAPLSIMTGLKSIRVGNAYIRSAGVLERLALTDTLFLSKNGIITMNTPRIDSVKTHGSYTKSDILHIAAALAGQSNHPLALTIQSEAHTSAVATKAKHALEIPGMGLIGRQKGHTLVMGRAELLESEGINIPTSFKSANGTVVYIAENSHFMGSIIFKDDFRDLSDKLSSALHRLGIKSVQLVSNDSAKSVEAAAKHAGIRTFYSNLQASDKITLVQNNPSNHLAFVGHTEPDAAALTTADVSIIFGEHKTPSADVAITDSSLKTLLSAIKTAKHTFKKARLNSLFGLVVVCLLVCFAALDTFSPLQSAGLQALVMFLTITSSTYVKLQTAKQ